MKKIISILLVLVIAFSLFACAKKSQSGQDGILIQNKDSKMEIGKAESALNPQEVYDSLSYTAPMFYGDYGIPGAMKGGDEGKEALKVFNESAEYTDNPMMEKDTWAKSISLMPIRMLAGKNSVNAALCFETKYDWAKLYFATDSGSYIERYFSYEISGNKIIFTHVTWSSENDGSKLTYELDKNVQLEYEFSFKGRALTLSKDGKSVELLGGKDVSDPQEDYLSVEHYLTDESAKPEGFNKLNLLYSSKDSSNTRLYVISEQEKDGKTDSEQAADAVALVGDDGLFTLSFEDKAGEQKTQQYVYFYCGEDGLVLADKTNAYYFNYNYTQHLQNGISKNIDIDEIDMLARLKEAELEALRKKQEELTADLVAAFKKDGITVSVDTKNGELAMDATVLFGGDSADITDEGKAFLDKFINAYTTIIFSEKYDGFVKKTLVEGHIAPVDGVTYESGMPFSEKRATNVMNYCLESEKAYQPEKLEKSMEAVGYSNSKPIYTDSGEVNFEASRRVSFKFLIDPSK